MGRQRVAAAPYTAAFVSALAHPDFLVEMDAIAIVPDGVARPDTGQA